MNYDESLYYINTLPKYMNKHSLDTTKELLTLLGSHQDKLRVIHVVGTNGKGSTCSMLSSILQKAGYRVGLLTTPFLTRFNEVIKINNIPISDIEISSILSRIHEVIETMSSQPTRFGVTVVAAIEYFYAHSCDVVILETGLGGNYDGTNVVKSPDAVVFTAIDIDHTRQLGSTIESITQSKADTIKADCDIVFYGQNPVALRVIENKCKEVNARLHVVNYSGLEVLSNNARGCSINYTVDDIAYTHMFTPLVGNHQVFNLALVLTTVHVLQNKFEITDEAIRSGLLEVNWPGRFEVLYDNPLFIFDGCHNPHAVTAFVKSIKQYFPDTKITAIMGAMSDKDVESMVKIVHPIVKSVYTVSSNESRSASSKLLGTLFDSKGIPTTVCESIEHGIRLAIEQANESDIICMIGSLHTYKDAVATLTNLKQRS